MLGNQHKVLEKLMIATTDQGLVDYIAGMLDAGKFRSDELAIQFYNRCHAEYYRWISDDLIRIEKEMERLIKSHSKAA